jgi:hypothetical protein
MPEQDQQYDDWDRDAEQPKKYCGHFRSSKVVIHAAINVLFSAAQLVALSRQRASALFACSVVGMQGCNHNGTGDATCVDQRQRQLTPPELARRICSAPLGFLQKGRERARTS